MRASRLLLAGLAGSLLGGLAAAQTEPVLSGTFIQLNGGLAGLSQEAWLEEVGHMKALGFDTLIIQYSRYGDDSYHRTDDAAAEQASGGPANESIGTMEWQAPAGFETKHLRLTVLPASREWTMIPEVRVLADGRNIAAGLPYRLSPAPAGTYTDPDAHEGGKLTDGAANFAWADMVGWQNPGDRIVIDLEFPETTAVHAVEADFMRSDASAVEPPAGFTVSASADGSTWEQAGPQAGWSATGTDAPYDPIGNVLAAAEQEGLDVWLGLALDPDYWSGRFDPDASAAGNTGLLLELEHLYGASPALSGWYLPEEIDDRSFVTPLTREAMFSYLEKMTEAAHTKTGRPVMVAPYFGMNPQPKEIAAWWDAALERAAIDVIAMQDGVGTRRTTVEEGVPVYRELAAVTARHGTELWSDLEIFEQIHGWPVDDRAFAAVPARMETVASQLEQEAPFVSKFVSFDFTHHMSPRLGGEAERLYREYTDWLKERETR